MAELSRQGVLAELRQKVAAGRPIIGGGAGTGISAKLEAAGGIDLIIIYNSGRFRMAGRGSLAGMMPYGDANAIVLDMAREVIPIVPNTPVLAGVCGTDPFRVMRRFLKEIGAAGFVGVQNFPTVGLIDGTFRANLEETEMGFGLEVDMIREAPEQDLLTTPYAFNPDEAAAMAKAGADILIPHMGLTTKGSDWSQHRRHAGRSREKSASHARCGQEGQPGDSGPLSRRTHRGTRRCPVHPGPHRGHRGLLRSLKHGTPAGRTGHHGADSGIHFAQAVDVASVRSLNPTSFSSEQH